MIRRVIFGGCDSGDPQNGDFESKYPFWGSLRLGHRRQLWEVSHFHFGSRTRKPMSPRRSSTSTPLLPHQAAGSRPDKKRTHSCFQRNALLWQACKSVFCSHIQAFDNDRQQTIRQTLHNSELRLEAAQLEKHGCRRPNPLLTLPAMTRCLQELLQLAPQAL